MRDRLVKQMFGAGVVLAMMLVTTLVFFAEPPSNAQSVAADPDTELYAPDGADTCLTCHTNPRVTPVLNSVHWVKANPKTPGANQECESCHGASADHYRSMQSPTVVFGEATGRFPASEVAVQNQACLSCHESGQRIHWASSEHQFGELTCVSCHQIHQEGSPAPQGMASVDLCLGCHLEKRAQINMRSHHPLTEGLMTCSSCHNPHGSEAATLLAKASVNDTCTSCHAEKRGPFLWEHEPVTDSCTTCHNPHGATQSRMLTSRPPFLCQTCHSDVFHPSSLYSGTGLPPVGAAQQSLGSACTNCHSQIHGSNHPSGARLTR